MTFIAFVDRNRFAAASAAIAFMVRNQPHRNLGYLIDPAIPIAGRFGAGILVSETEYGAK
jgi:hypothetical protein